MSTVNAKRIEALEAYLDVERKRNRMLHKAFKASNKRRRELAREMLEERQQLADARQQLYDCNESHNELAAVNTRLTGELDAARTRLFAETTATAKREEDIAYAQREHTRLHGGVRSAGDALRNAEAFILRLPHVNRGGTTCDGTVCVCGKSNMHAAICKALVDLAEAHRPASDNVPDCNLPRVEDWYRWVLEIEVHKTWVEDGFDLTDERAHSILAHALPYAYGAELRAKVLEAPDAERIRIEQGGKPREPLRSGALELPE